MRVVIIFSLFFSYLYSLEIDANEQIYLSALEVSGSQDDAVNLHKLYLKQGRRDDAEKLKVKFWRKSVNNPIYRALEKNERDIEFARADRLESIYKRTNSFEDFKECYYELEGLGHKDIGFEKLEQFVDNHKMDEDAVLFLSSRYYWDSKPKKSLKILKPLIDSKSSNKKITSLYKKIKAENPTRVVKKKRIKKAKKYSINYKQKAEKLYFKGEFLKSISYYKKYFTKKSKDSNARFHYAAALENLQKFKRSQVEYNKVVQNVDDLYELSSFRYARVLMAQRDSYKWEEARVVLENLQQVLLDTAASKKTDDLLKYVGQSLEAVYKPLPEPSQHKDVMLTSEQRKILDKPTLEGDSIAVQNVSSVKSMLNPRLSSVNNDMDVEATMFGLMVNEEDLQKREFGVKVSVSSVSVEVKKSTFKNGKKLEAQSLGITYDNSDDMSISVGVNSFDDDTKFNAKLNYTKVYDKHNITYGTQYQNGIFKNSSPCMIDNDINVLSLSVYDAYLLESMKHTELTLELNSFGDGNLNLNTWVGYPLYNHIKGDFENIFSLTGSYEMNSKDDTCYGASEFFDASYLEMKSKYALKNGYIEAKGSIGYSVENTKVVYSYGFLLSIYTANSVNIYVDCSHYQSGYSPDGADQCYASVSYVW